MATNKTAPSDADPRAFIDGLEDDRRRAEALELLELFEERTGEKPKMWGDSIIGFGDSTTPTHPGARGRGCAPDSRPASSR